MRFISLAAAFASPRLRGSEGLIIRTRSIRSSISFKIPDAKSLFSAGRLASSINSSTQIRSTSTSTSSSTVDTLLFDMDGCLYSGDNGMKEHMQSRILRFLVEKSGDDKFDAITNIEEARAVWEPLFRKYNQSYRGLTAGGFQIDMAEFNAYFREGSEMLMKRDEPLRDLLHSLPQRKIIFTNAPEASAKKCLEAMGIRNCFEHVFGAEFMYDCCKPEAKAFEKVLLQLDINPNDPSDVSRVCFFEDSHKNLVQGKNMGMKTVFVYCSTAEEEGLKDKNDVHGVFDVVLEDIGRDLEIAMPSLWAN